MDGPHAALCAALLAWELTDDVAAARDTEEAGRTLANAWLRAAVQYDALDGRHEHGAMQTDPNDPETGP